MNIARLCTAAGDHRLQSRVSHCQQAIDQSVNATIKLHLHQCRINSLAKQHADLFHCARSTFVEDHCTTEHSSVYSVNTRTVLTRRVSSYGLPAALSDYGVNAAGIAEIVVKNDSSLAEMPGSFA